MKNRLYTVEYMDEIRNGNVGLNQSDSFYKKVKCISNIGKIRNF